MNMIPIDLGDRVECLIAKREPVCVALYQPMADLTVSDTRGPCYDSNRKDIISKVRNFLSHANKVGSQLIILPEFATPIDILADICKGNLKFAEGSLLILPLEALLLAEYQKLNKTIVATKLNMVLGKLGKIHSGITWVNACAIVAVTRDGIKVYVQPKRFEAKPEFGSLCCGDEYFVFTGKGLSLSVFICADANESRIYEPQLKDTKIAARGAYFIHTQWNPNPQYDLYDDFWKKIILSENGDNHILISLNMATNSKIREGSKILTIPLPLTRIACSGDAKIDEKYMSPKIYSAFKSVLGRDKWGIIFNLAYPHDSCHLLTLRRPYENVDDAVNLTNHFLISSQMFSSDNGTITEYPRDVIASSFIKYLVNINASFKDETIDQIKALSFEDIEILIASFLQEKKYTWLKKDILERPFIWSTFFNPLGIANVCSRNAMDHFITTLKKIDECDTLGYRIMPFDKISKYPINLFNNNDHGYGWIFNCKGLSDVIIEDVAISLLDIDCVRKGSIITLFPTNCTAAFCADSFKNNIERAAIKITEPDNNLIQDFDTTSPKPRPSIRVNIL